MEGENDNTALTVECYSGYTYAQEPRAFTWQGERRMIEAVERAWRTPEGPCFVVRVGGNGRFQLLYREHVDQWSITGLDDP
jgi:hypothetical protein